MNRADIPYAVPSSRHTFGRQKRTMLDSSRPLRPRDEDIAKSSPTSPDQRLVSTGIIELRSVSAVRASSIARATGMGGKLPRTDSNSVRNLNPCASSRGPSARSVTRLHHIGSIHPLRKSTYATTSEILNASSCTNAVSAIPTFRSTRVCCETTHVTLCTTLVTYARMFFIFCPFLSSPLTPSPGRRREVRDG